MSGGPSFLGDLGGFDLGSLFEQLRMSPQGFDPSAAAPGPVPSPMGGLNPYSPQPLPIRGAGDTDPSGRGVGPIDQRRPSIAMNEDQTQALERVQAGLQDLAALGGSPTDRLLFDRAGMGGGANPFTGTAGATMPDAYGARPTPLPPQRPSDADLMFSPTATGSVPDARAPSATSNASPAPPVSPASTGNPASSNLQPVNAFDPLTGARVSGSPKLMGAPGMGGPTEGGGGQAPAAGYEPGSFFQKFAQGLNNPTISDLLFHVGIGLMSKRGLGEGLASGLQSYGASQGNQTRQLLEQYKLANEINGQNATRAYLRSKGLPSAAVEAGTLNSTLLTNMLSQENRAPNIVDYGGVRYLVPPGAANDQSQWQRVGTVNGPQPGFEADPSKPGAERYVVGSQADPNYKGSVAGAEAKAKDEAVGDKLVNVRPGGVLFDPNTRQPVYTAPGNEPEGFKTEDKLRTEFSKQLGTFGQVHDGYGRVIAATKQREANPAAVSPASDIGLVFGFMKMLDPGSVVREGEYATAKNAAGVPERVLNAYNKVLKGEFLSTEQRKDFLGQAAELYGTARHTADGVAERYRGLATQYGVDPGRSVYLPEAPTPPKLGAPASQETSEIPRGAPTGTRRAPDGNLYAPDPARPGKYLQVR